MRVLLSQKLHDAPWSTPLAGRVGRDSSCRGWRGLSAIVQPHAPLWDLILPDLNTGELHVSMHELWCKGVGGGGLRVEC